MDYEKVFNELEYSKDNGVNIPQKYLDEYENELTESQKELLSNKMKEYPNIKKDLVFSLVIFHKFTFEEALKEITDMTEEAKRIKHESV
jgi:hypothetical protein